jgi:DNA-binding NtrC family response regulator
MSTRYLAVNDENIGGWMLSAPYRIFSVVEKMKRNGTTLRVLFVDDEPLILHIISRFLNRSVMVKTVTSAEEALDEIVAQHYDLCFLDIILPGMTGLDAMKIINELSPTTKVALMTGSHLDEALKKKIEDTAYAFIQKPFELIQIKEVVDRVAATSIV